MGKVIRDRVPPGEPLARVRLASSGRYPSRMSFGINGAVGIGGLSGMWECYDSVLRSDG